jgi:hypothetical protein
MNHSFDHRYQPSFGDSLLQSTDPSTQVALRYVSSSFRHSVDIEHVRHLVFRAGPSPSRGLDSIEVSAPWGRIPLVSRIIMGGDGESHAPYVLVAGKHDLPYPHYSRNHGTAMATTTAENKDPTGVLQLMRNYTRMVDIHDNVSANLGDLTLPRVDMVRFYSSDTPDAPWPCSTVVWFKRGLWQIPDDPPLTPVAVRAQRVVIHLLDAYGFWFTPDFGHTPLVIFPLASEIESLLRVAFNNTLNVLLTTHKGPITLLGPANKTVRIRSLLHKLRLQNPPTFMTFEEYRESVGADQFQLESYSASFDR